MRKTFVHLLAAIVIIAATVFVTLAVANLPVEKSENLNSTLWVQTSVEYKMSSLQAYKLAEEKL